MAKLFDFFLKSIKIFNPRNFYKNFDKKNYNPNKEIL